MARGWNKLTANAVRGATKRGRYSDGGNLFLQVTKNGTASWIFKYERNGVARSMGLGALRSVPLALARDLAAQAREQRARGLDPIAAREAAGLAEQAARAKLTTFRECTLEFHSLNASRWRNAKHAAEWLSTLRRYAFPTLGHLSVDVIDSGLVQRVLAPLVASKPVTASRLRGRIEVVLDYAKAAGRRDGENPADKTTILHMLPMRSEKSVVENQPSLPHAKLPALMRALRATPGTAARQLELIILTGMRADAVRLARFEEFDLVGRVWKIPASRMKALQHDHRIPLGERVVEIVRELRAATNGALLFAGADSARPVGPNEAWKVLGKLLKNGVPATVHGFRATFKTWCHEARSLVYPTEAVEAALGHRIRGSIARAYLRSDFFDQRKPLMLDWEGHCNGVATAKVVKLRA